MNKPFFRMAAIDLDGTLLGPDGLVGTRNRAAVQALAVAGVTPIIASGRMHSATLAIHDALGLDSPVVSYNGAMVVDPIAGETLLHEPLDATIAMEIVRWGEAESLDIQYYLDDTLYVARDNQWSRLYQKRTWAEVHAAGSLTRFDGQCPTKIIFVGPPEETLRWQEVWRERLGKSAYIVRTMPEYLEFLNPAVDKWEGIRVVARRYGYPESTVIAFGDSHNDVPMLLGAGIGVAMPFSPAEVLDAADVVGEGTPEEAFGATVERLLAGEWAPVCA